MSEIIEIGPLRLIFAYAFVLLLLILVRGQGIAKEKEIIISTLRMTVQLILMGYVLVYIFDQSLVYVTLAVFFLPDAVLRHPQYFRPGKSADQQETGPNHHRLHG